jgi:polysaccharide biosynthesis/export protein
MRKFQFIILSTLVFFSCVTPRKTHYLQEPDGVIPSYSETIFPPDYKVQFNDELYIRVMTLNPESKRIFNPHQTTSSGGGVATTTAVKGLLSYTVYDDGTIDFPYLGAVSVGNKTTREIKVLLEEKLRDYVKDCSVDVRLVNSYVNVLTNTGASRVQLLKEHTNIFEVLAMSQGLSPYAKRSDVKIVRETVQGTEVYSFDLRSKDIIHSDFYYVKPNDVIYIPDFEGQFFRLNNFMTVLTTTTTTISFGFFVWKIIDLWIPKQ